MEIARILTSSLVGMTANEGRIQLSLKAQAAASERIVVS